MEDNLRGLPSEAALTTIAKGDFVFVCVFGYKRPMLKARRYSFALLLFHRSCEPKLLLFSVLFWCPIKSALIMSGRGKGGKVKSKAKTRSSRAGLQFPVGRIHRLLRKGMYTFFVLVASNFHLVVRVDLFCVLIFHPFSLQATMVNVSVPVLPSIWLPSWNIWPLKFLNWPATLLATTRKLESFRVTYNWPSVMTRN